jgi:hypothetical protein
MTRRESFGFLALLAGMAFFGFLVATRSLFGGLIFTGMASAILALPWLAMRVARRLLVGARWARPMVFSSTPPPAH